jgi:threonine/homoserine/homoserine lactone efflux protein
MIPASQLLYYALSVFILIIIPGPTMFYLISRSLSQGWKAGIVSLLGVITADIFYIVSVILGISSLLLNAPQVFNYIKIAGGVYLTFLAYKTITNKSKSSETVNTHLKRDNYFKLYSVGLLTNITNPKVALFFVAIFLQFTNAEYGSVWIQSVVLGLIFILISFSGNSLFILGASKSSNWLSKNPKLEKAQNFLMAGILFFLGIKMLTSLI